MAKFYVQARMRRGQVLGYGVYDSIGGMVSEHAYYEIGEHYTAEVALHLANTDRDDRNAGIADAERNGRMTTAMDMGLTPAEARMFL